MSIVHQSHGRLNSASKHLLSEVAIVGRLARRTLGNTPAIPWDGFEADYVDRVAPGGATSLRDS